MPARSFMRMLLLGASIFLSFGCRDNTGGLRPSAEVTQAFEALDVPASPSYRYWYLNTENNPFAVAGLSDGYWLGGPDWHACDPVSPEFKKVLDRIHAFPAQGNRVSGYVILDHNGNEIGIWYSSLSAGITVEPESKKVLIATATPWVQER